jgi:hypothetical protein
MADRRRIAAALEYLGAMRDRAAEFGSGVAGSLANRARDVGGLAYEALTSDPNIGRMNTAEFAQAAASRAPTPRLDAAGQGAVELGRAVLTQPVQTGKAIVQGEVDRARQAMTSPRAAGEYAGSMVDPLRLASALRRPPMQEAAPQGGKVVGIRSRQIAAMANRINEAMGGGPQSLSDNVQQEMKLATSVLQSKNPQAVEDWIQAYYNSDLPMEQFEAATSNLRKTLPPETVDALIQNAGTFRTADQFKAFLNATPEERAKQLAKVSKQGSGTRNFVVFPGEEKKVKILRRE